MDLNLIWFLLLGVLLTGYAILDGFDLGVGILHPISKNDEERRVFMNSIGPLWDGNEVWLITFGGALFAAFPIAYASVFSTFYTPFMILLFALIFRGVSMEFRSKRPSALWRGFWDWAFCLSSAAAALLFGIAVGNAIQGVAIDVNGVYRGSFIDFLNVYSLMVGLMVVALFAMHGSLYLYLKTEGDIQKRIHEWIWHTFGIFMVCYMITTVYTLIKIPQATENFEHLPFAWAVVVLNILAIANIPRAIYMQCPGYAFLSSCGTIAALTLLFGLALYPSIFVSSIDPAYSLTIYNAASSQKTLTIMFVIAVIGMPFVLAYTSVIYWVFRGKVKLEHTSY